MRIAVASVWAETSFAAARQSDANMRKPRRKLSRQDAIYSISLAGISAAVALLFVWLGVLVRFSTVAFFIAAGIAVMVPLTKKYYISSLFAYAVSAGLSFVVVGDITSVIGYVAYFGPMALITGFMCNRKVKWFIALPVKAAYINGALALMYFVCHSIVIDSSIMQKVDYWVIALVGTVVLLAIDFVLQFMYSRLIPIVSKALRKSADSSDSQAKSSKDSDGQSGSGDDVYHGNNRSDGGYGVGEYDCDEYDDEDDAQDEIRSGNPFDDNDSPFNEN